MKKLLLPLFILLSSCADKFYTENYTIEELRELNKKCHEQLKSDVKKNIFKIFLPVDGYCKKVSDALDEKEFYEALDSLKKIR